jgi:hypothetical protein
LGFFTFDTSVRDYSPNGKLFIQKQNIARRKIRCRRQANPKPQASRRPGEAEGEPVTLSPLGASRRSEVKSGSEK